MKTLTKITAALTASLLAASHVLAAYVSCFDRVTPSSADGHIWTTPIGTSSCAGASSAIIAIYGPDNTGNIQFVMGTSTGYSGCGGDLVTLTVLRRGIPGTGYTPVYTNSFTNVCAPYPNSPANSQLFTNSVPACPSSSTTSAYIGVVTVFEKDIWGDYTQVVARFNAHVAKSSTPMNNTDQPLVREF